MVHVSKTHQRAREALSRRLAETSGDVAAVALALAPERDQRTVRLAVHLAVRRLRLDATPNAKPR